jgi:hypothetical protein
LTLGAIAQKLDIARGDLNPVVFCQILVDPCTVAALEFDHPSTSYADHVMVLPIAYDLVAVLLTL